MGAADSAGAELSTALSDGNLEPNPTVASVSGATLEAAMVGPVAVDAGSENGDFCARTTPAIATQPSPAIAQAVVTRRMGEPPSP
jgi:hypothetical protein